MPYYLAQFVTIDSRGRRAPVGFDSQPNRNWIALDTRAIIWLETPVSDARLVLLADDKAEKLAVSTRTAFANFLGDRTYLATDDFQFAITDLLRSPPNARGWKALASSFLRQRHEIWLGPGGRGNNLFWEQAALVAKHSKTYADTFNRADSDLDTSTSSDGLFTWDEVFGSTWVVAGSQASCPNIPDNEFKLAVTSADTDTDNSYAQTTLTTFTRTASTHLEMGVTTRGDTGQTNGYYIGYQVSSANIVARLLSRLSDAVTLDSDSVTITPPAELRVVADGSSISGYVDDVQVLGPITDTVEGSGVGNRRGNIWAYASGVSTNDVEVDDFGYGDLDTSPPYVPTASPTVFYVASGTVGENGGGNLNVPPPNGRNSGDILILHKYSRDNVVGSVAGYSQVLGQNQGSALRMEIWAKICGASEGSAVITRTAGTVMNAVLSCYRGNVNAGASEALRAIDKPSGTTFSAAASNETRIARYNNFSPQYGYERMVWAMTFGNDYGTAHAAPTGTAPSATQRYTNETTSGADLSGALADGELKFVNGALVGAGQSTFTNGAGGSAPYMGACFGIIPATAPLAWQMWPSPPQNTYIRM